MESNNPICNDMAQYEIDFHKKDFVAARKVCSLISILCQSMDYLIHFQTLNKIINNLLKINTPDNSNKTFLIINLIKRIKLNFHLRQHQSNLKNC